MFDDFPSVRILLVALCIIGVIGLKFLAEELSLLTQLRRDLRECLSHDLPEAISTGISKAAQEQKQDEELAFLTSEDQFLKKVGQKERQAKPFVFTLDSEAAKLMEEIQPGSTAGWQRSPSLDEA